MDTCVSGKGEENTGAKVNKSVSEAKDEAKITPDADTPSRLHSSHVQ